MLSMKQPDFADTPQLTSHINYVLILTLTLTTPDPDRTLKLEDKPDFQTHMFVIPLKQYLYTVPILLIN